MPHYPSKQPSWTADYPSRALVFQRTLRDRICFHCRGGKGSQRRACYPDCLQQLAISGDRVSLSEQIREMNTVRFSPQSLVGLRCNSETSASGIVQQSPPHLSWDRNAEFLTHK